MAEVMSVTAVPLSGSEVEVRWSSNNHYPDIAYFTVYLTMVSPDNKIHDVFSVHVPSTDSSVVVPINETTLKLRYLFQVSATVLDGGVESDRSPLTQESTITFGVCNKNVQ